MALQQLVEISTGNVVYEHDDTTGPLPEFGGPWGDKNLHEWRPAPKSAILAKAKQDKIAQLKSEYNTLVNSDITYSGAQFQADERSQIRIDQAINRLANGWTPANFQWIDSTNTPHPADLAFLNGLADAIATRTHDLFVRLQTAKSKVNSAKSVTAVNKVKL